MKVKTQYGCQNCGYVTAKWLGRCPACEAWNTLAEEKPAASEATEGSLAAFRDEWKQSGAAYVALEAAANDASQSQTTSPGSHRYSTGIQELNRVLGGGLVPDSFCLLGGDPGIGKSTILLQMSRGLLENNSNLKILYVSGEESIDQIRGRALRLGVKGEGRIFLAAETQLERVIQVIRDLKPQVVIMDSLQTFSTGQLESAPGSVSQLREVAARLMTLAKSAGICVWLVGHVTKDGNIAGPKVVEHMVDTVLYFEGDGAHSYRLLRTVKNRFGSTRELGVFDMDGEGLKEVSNPSSLFLSERSDAVPGTAVTASLEGSRPILVELQALVTPSGLAMPRRTAVGMESARVALIAAILERHMRLSLAQQDLFFNVSGGMRLTEPACDLAAAAAIWSSANEVAIPAGWLLIGELGLTGEVRKVSQTDVRIQEAKKLGFSTIVVPSGTPQVVLGKVKGVTIVPISRVAELRDLVGSKPKARARSSASSEISV